MMDPEWRNELNSEARVIAQRDKLQEEEEKTHREQAEREESKKRMIDELAQRAILEFSKKSCTSGKLPRAEKSVPF